MKSIRRLLVPVAVCAAVVSGSELAGAQERAVSLNEIVGAVRSQNPRLQASRKFPEIHYQRGQDVSLSDPGLSFSYFPVPIFTARGSQQWILRGHISLPLPGKIGLKKDLAAYDAAAASLAAEELENQLVFEAKRAYFRLYRIVRQLELARDYQARLTGFEEAASKRYEVGIGHQQDILKSQVERRNLDAEIAAYEADRRSAQKVLARLQNDRESGKIDPVGFLELPRIPNVATEVIVYTALSHRPEVALIDTLARRKDVEIALGRKEWLPDLGLQVTYHALAAETVPAGADGKNALGIGASIRLPIFGGNRNAGVEAAEIERTQLEFDRIAIETEVRAKVEDLVFRAERERQQIQILNEALIPQAETTVEVALSGYTTGQSGFLDLLDAERTLYSFRNRLEETIERYAVAVAELERTVGVPAHDMTSEDLGKR